MDSVATQRRQVPRRGLGDSGDQVILAVASRTGNPIVLTVLLRERTLGRDVQDLIPVVVVVVLSEENEGRKSVLPVLSRGDNQCVHAHLTATPKVHRERFPGVSIAFDLRVSLLPEHVASVGLGAGDLPDKRRNVNVLGSTQTEETLKGGTRSLVGEADDGDRNGVDAGPQDGKMDKRGVVPREFAVGRQDDGVKARLRIPLLRLAAVREGELHVERVENDLVDGNHDASSVGDVELQGADAPHFRHVEEPLEGVDLSVATAPEGMGVRCPGDDRLVHPAGRELSVPLIPGTLHVADELERDGLVDSRANAGIVSRVEERKRVFRRVPVDRSDE